MRIYLRGQGNINNFRDQKAGKKFESNFGNKETITFLPPPRPHRYPGRDSDLKGFTKILL